MKRRLYKQRILWNATTVEVAYDPDWLGAATVPEDAIGHLQIRSLNPAGAPLPVTETGYLSHFAPAAEILDAGGPLAYARAWLDHEAATKRWRAHEEASRQYALL